MDKIKKRYAIAITKKDKTYYVKRIENFFNLGIANIRLTDIAERAIKFHEEQAKTCIKNMDLNGYYVKRIRRENEKYFTNIK